MNILGDMFGAKLTWAAQVEQKKANKALIAIKYI
jgi:hypothetical protein